jgi:hypothetical protein
MSYWGFGNTANINQMHSYKEIKDKYDNTRPIRGRSRDTRPVGSRNYADRTINKNWKSVEDDCVGAWQVTYSINVWGTDRVEFFPNGKLLIRTGGYSNPTINSTINYAVADSFGELLSVNGKQYFQTKDGKGYCLRDKGELLLEPTGEEIQSKGYWNGMAQVMRPINATQETRYSVNRKVMNSLRKKYNEFIQYGISMFLIDDKVEVSGEELEKFFGKANNTGFGYAQWDNAKQKCKENRERLIKEIDKFLASGDLEHAYLLARYVGRSAGGWYSRCSPKDFKRHFEEILKFEYKHEVFNATPVPLGTMFYDANAKYFN